MSSLNELVHSEASKMGVSSSNASRALKMLKKGKLDMSKIAPQIKDMFMNNNPMAKSATSARDRLRAKIASKNSMRMSHAAKKLDYDRSREKMKAKEEQRKKDKQNKVRLERNRRRRHKKKLTMLEKRLGEISIVVYNKCLEKINGDLSDQEKQNCNNIIELYQRQQKFTNKIETNELDDLIENDDELSDLSDLSDIES